MSLDGDLLTLGTIVEAGRKHEPKPEDAGRVLGWNLDLMARRDEETRSFWNGGITIQHYNR